MPSLSPQQKKKKYQFFNYSPFFFGRLSVSVPSLPLFLQNTYGRRLFLSLSAFLAHSPTHSIDRLSVLAAIRDLTVPATLSLSPTSSQPSNQTELRTVVNQRVIDHTCTTIVCRMNVLEKYPVSHITSHHITSHQENAYCSLLFTTKSENQSS